jgi:hypothetical protein
MRKSTAELQELGDKIVRLVSARTSNIIRLADETIKQELTEYDLDQLLQSLEQDLADNGIQAIFYPI